MDKEKVTKKLIGKKEKLIETTHKYDNCVKLCRTKWYNDYKNSIIVDRKTKAIDLAIELINNQISKIDLYQYALSIIPVSLGDIQDKYLMKSESIYLNERKECARYLISNFLPICKKEILNCI